ncbi:hypothetical protein AB0M20_45270, partial [Actinoplanes sp. NPDC051633]|uniref:hypothetical protein n=1 Tax=Actinoplanes sp. NPDC051633 TaxID=3155670 RepID=UPI00341DA2CE
MSAGAGVGLLAACGGNTGRGSTGLLVLAHALLVTRTRTLELPRVLGSVGAGPGELPGVLLLVARAVQVLAGETTGLRRVLRVDAGHLGGAAHALPVVDARHARGLRGVLLVVAAGDVQRGTRGRVAAGQLGTRATTRRRQRLTPLLGTGTGA